MEILGWVLLILTGEAIGAFIYWRFISYLIEEKKRHGLH